ncbi:MAG: ABC transporter ATP-binding protein [Pirellulaceae bacterium]|nr:ABC transporter ATP-binding protein [Pirellulaceae bacterium]
MTLLEVDNLVKHFPVRGGLLSRVVGRVHAVNGVSFQVPRGETLGIVGESGCGKSTLGKVLLRLLEPTSGRIVFDQQDLTQLSYRQLRPFRSRAQIVFQDPNSSLNPRLTVAAMLREVIRFHRIVPLGQTDEYIRQLLGKVGMPADAQGKYPHEFSGGQRQRLGIARALAVKPEFIVADEPVSALDVSIQAQVLNLLMDLKEEFSLTLLFISHDLKVIAHFCDRVLVMYLGYVVEELPCLDIQRDARHPYTQALLAANPINDPDERRELRVLEGEVPSPYNPPAGCPFVTRCPLVMDRCHQEMPPLETRAPGHRVACWALDPPRPGMG